MTATFNPVDFRDVQVGDRLRFLTRDTGFGGYGIHDRTGNVTRITDKTVRIICDDGDTAIIRRADWRAREPRKEVAQQETIDDTAHEIQQISDEIDARIAAGRTDVSDLLDRAHKGWRREAAAETEAGQKERRADREAKRYRESGRLDLAVKASERRRAHFDTWMLHARRVSEYVRLCARIMKIGG